MIKIIQLILTINFFAACMYQFRIMSLSQQLDKRLRRDKRRIGYSIDFISSRGGRSKYWKSLEEKNLEWQDSRVEKLLNHRFNFMVYGILSWVLLVLVMFAGTL